MSAQADLVDDVRADYRSGDARLETYRKSNGVTPDYLAAMSWMARDALASKDYAKADGYAEKTYQLSLAELKKRALDQERRLPIALGAAIEVRAQVMAARGERSGAIAFLNDELKTHRTTSIRTRIQKNINLLSLVGGRAPAIDNSEYVGLKPPALAALRGKPVLIFLWAHWCGDCKAQAADLGRIRTTYKKRVAILAPTQRFGYTAGGDFATPDVERKYIDEVRLKFYDPFVPGMPVSIGEETFRNYGASTTPTLVLVDAGGIVRLYHPGRMTFDELKPHLDRLLSRRPTDAAPGSPVTD